MYKSDPRPLATVEIISEDLANLHYRFRHIERPELVLDLKVIDEEVSLDGTQEAIDEMRPFVSRLASGMIKKGIILFKEEG